MRVSRRSIAAAIAFLLAATLTAELVFAASNWEYYSARGVEAIEHFLHIALFGFLGSLIAYRRPGNPIGWVLVGVAILRQLGALAAPGETETHRRVAAVLAFLQNEEVKW